MRPLVTATTIKTQGSPISAPSSSTPPVNPPPHATPGPFVLHLPSCHANTTGPGFLGLLPASTRAVCCFLTLTRTPQADVGVCLATHTPPRPDTEIVPHVRQ